MAGIDLRLPHRGPPPSRGRRRGAVRPPRHRDRPDGEGWHARPRGAGPLCRVGRIRRSPFPASSTVRSGPSPTSVGTPSRRWPRTPVPPDPTRPPGRVRWGSAWRSWPTTCGSPTAGRDGRASTALSVARAAGGGAPVPPSVRTLGLPMRDGAQVSCNLIDPATRPSPTSTTPWPPGPWPQGCSVTRAELVGLLPEAALHSTPPARWSELDLGRGQDHRVSGWPVGPSIVTV